MGERWYVEVDRDICIGSGMCTGTAPDDFTLDSAHQSHPVTAERAPSEEVMDAAENCPVEAITIKLVETGEMVFPPED